MNAGTIKVLVAVGALIVAAVLATRNLRGDSTQTRAFFYDQSERKLFMAPGDSAPPLAGIGGDPDDAVRAIVIAPRGEEQDEAKRVVAFLETFTPELKKLIEDRRAALSRGESAPEADDREFIARNTLVRLPEAGSEWIPESSQKGQAITVSWQNRPSPNGKGWVVCRP